MGLKDLHEAGLTRLMDDAAAVLRAHGHTQGITCDRATGAVDVHGAMLLAAGARQDRLYGFVTDPDDAGVPAARVGHVWAAYDILEAVVGGELSEWNDTTSGEIVERVIRSTADRLRIAII
jgi:hypothetical protein